MAQTEKRAARLARMGTGDLSAVMNAFARGVVQEVTAVVVPWGADPTAALSRGLELPGKGQGSRHSRGQR
jgi:hypothetical protein